MGSMVIREAVTKTCIVRFDGKTTKHRVTVREKLRGSQCAACGSIFQMRQAYKDQIGVGIWSARMSGAPGRLGNGFNLSCCSFECAHHLESGGWMDPIIDDPDRSFIKDKARQYADAGCVTVFVEFVLGEVLYEDDLIEEWEASELRNPRLTIVDEHPRHQRYDSRIETLEPEGSGE